MVRGRSKPRYPLRVSIRVKTLVALVAVLAVAAAAGLGVAALSGADNVTTTVTRVVDGDTIDVADPIAGATRIRILGIDTPEVYGSEVQCFGPEASAWAREHLLGRTVTLVPDPSQDALDRHGRALAYVTDGDWDYSVEAARAGMARSDDYGVRRDRLISTAEAQARSADRGLWAACE